MLARLVALIDRINAAPDRASLEFTAVNDIREVIEFSHAALFMNDDFKLCAVSGVAEFAREGTYAHWLSGVGAKLGTLLAGNAPQSVTRDTLPDGAAQADLLPDAWAILPLMRHDRRIGALILGRDRAWSDAHEWAIMTRIGASVAQGFHGLSIRARPTLRLSRKIMIATAIAGLAGLVPVHTTMIGRAEIVPAEPAQIVAPFDGRVLHTTIEPNAIVHRGDVLATMDQAEIVDACAVARQTLAVARAQYEEASQSGVDDLKARADIGPLRDRIASAQADLAYQQSLLEKAHVISPISGVALYADQQAWTGKPVQAGEKIMTVAQDHSAILKIAVAPDGLWQVPDHARVTFYNNTRPDQPVGGEMISRAYAPRELGDTSSVYEFRARLDTQAQLGDEGTGRIEGPRMMLILWLLHRPWQAIRPWIQTP